MKYISQRLKAGITQTLERELCNRQGSKGERVNWIIGITRNGEAAGKKIPHFIRDFSTHATLTC
jgi:hypothetical protein